MRHRLKRLTRRFYRRRGFSLVEALAAFAILTAVLGQLLSGVSGAARNESRADFLERASRQGAAQLEALGADGAMPIGVTQGRYEDGLLWRLVVEQNDQTKSQPGAPSANSFLVSLTVTRPNGDGAIDFTTAKIISIAPQQPGVGFGAPVQ